MTNINIEELDASGDLRQAADDAGAWDPSGTRREMLRKAGIGGAAVFGVNALLSPLDAFASASKGQKGAYSTSGAKSIRRGKPNANDVKIGNYALTLEYLEAAFYAAAAKANYADTDIAAFAKTSPSTRPPTSRRSRRSWAGLRSSRRGQHRHGRQAAGGPEHVHQDRRGDRAGRHRRLRGRRAVPEQPGDRQGRALDPLGRGQPRRLRGGAGQAEVHRRQRRPDPERVQPGVQVRQDHQDGRRAEPRQGRPAAVIDQPSVVDFDGDEAVAEAMAGLRGRGPRAAGCSAAPASPPAAWASRPLVLVLRRTAGAREGGSKAQDIKILNFALTLEYLEAAFYAEAVGRGIYTGTVGTSRRRSPATRRRTSRRSRASSAPRRWRRRSSTSRAPRAVEDVPAHHQGAGGHGRRRLPGPGAAHPPERRARPGRRRSSPSRRATPRGSATCSAPARPSSPRLRRSARRTRWRPSWPPSRRPASSSPRPRRPHHVHDQNPGRLVVRRRVRRRRRTAGDGG